MALMKPSQLLTLLAVGGLVWSTLLLGQSPKPTSTPSATIPPEVTPQTVSGDVMDLSPTYVLIVKDGVRYEINRNASTRMSGHGLHIGASATVTYTPVASAIEVTKRSPNFPD